MPSSLNRKFSQAMTQLEDQDPDTYRAVKTKLEALKTEAATWRRQAQRVGNHGETSKIAMDGEEVHQ